MVWFSPTIAQILSHYIDSEYSIIDGASAGTSDEQRNVVHYRTQTPRVTGEDLTVKTSEAYGVEHTT